MTQDEFKVAAGITDELVQKWFYPVMVAMETCFINTPLRQAHFIAQISVESMGFQMIQESFNYSSEGLKIFGSRLTEQQRTELGRKHWELVLPVERQIAIANIVYGNRYGNNANGDGWKYRGRGLKQLTFRWNYIACGEDLGLDLEEKPELLLDPINAACSAGWFWKNNNCNYFADRNDISGLTRRINGGFNGLKLRTQHTNRAIAALTP
ncbi:MULTISPECIES: glycoside hydrolase family 19 protein [Erwinia]|uniref:glycoside hydrolase family 19 protein n=1 Tax=Erwinia TaxID=551 RepID=UPI00105B982F|nr:glycoside hydrolase family 19 protein [Erwinia aphidicola]MCP2234054.1 putative chitinase [Erwinia aphidicola]